MQYTHLSNMTDAVLAAAVKRLAGCERGVTVRLIAHLAEFDARRLYLPAGFPSLFQYCREVLRLSEHEAFHRILAARTARRFPRVMELLDSGALNLTIVRLLAPELTAENQDELLALASGKGRREVEKLLAHRRPRADVPFSIRRLRTPLAVASGDALAAATVSGASPDGGAMVGGPAMQDLATTGRLLAPPPASALSQPAALPPVVRPDQRPSRVTPLAPNRYEIRFTASDATCEALDLAKDLLRHAIPDGDTDAVIHRALRLLVEDLSRKKFAATTRPGRPRGTRTDSRTVPAEVRRAVSRRDAGGCAFVAKDGRRCGERGFLEFHHVKPFAEGGEAANMQLRCRAHNGHEADRFYGASRRGRAQAMGGEARVSASVAEAGGAGRTRPGPSRDERGVARYRARAGGGAPCM